MTEIRRTEQPRGSIETDSAADRTGGPDVVGQPWQYGQEDLDLEQLDAYISAAESQHRDLKARLDAISRD